MRRRMCLIGVVVCALLTLSAGGALAGGKPGEGNDQTRRDERQHPTAQRDDAAVKVTDTEPDDQPSGRDRDTERSPQGRSMSDPDGQSNGGMDKPGFTGGFDNDRDFNNGCGNDDDFEDDNKGWCGRKPERARGQQTTHASRLGAQLRRTEEADVDGLTEGTQSESTETSEALPEAALPAVEVKGVTFSRGGLPAAPGESRLEPAAASDEAAEVQGATFERRDARGAVETGVRPDARGAIQAGVKALPRSGAEVAALALLAMLSLASGGVAVRRYGHVTEAAKR